LFCINPNIAISEIRYISNTNDNDRYKNGVLFDNDIDYDSDIGHDIW
jgi:hypothetical protein